jgi:hypothetical protein
MVFVKEKKLEYLQAYVDEILKVAHLLLMQLSRLTPKEGCIIDNYFIRGNVCSISISISNT